MRTHASLYSISQAVRTCEGGCSRARLAQPWLHGRLWLGFECFLFGRQEEKNGCSFGETSNQRILPDQDRFIFETRLPPRSAPLWSLASHYDVGFDLRDRLFDDLLGRNFHSSAKIVNRC